MHSAYLRVFLLYFLVIVYPCRGQWIITNANVVVDLNCVAFSDDSTAVMGGKGRLFVTKDKGVTWTPVGGTGTLSDTIGYYKCNFRSIVYTGQAFIAVGSDTTQNTAVALSINPGGTSFSYVYSGSANSALHDVCMTGGYVIAVGKNGLALSSLNSGQTWTAITNLNATSDLLSVTSSQSSNNDLYILSAGVTYFNSGYPTTVWQAYPNTPSMSSFCAAYFGGLTGVGAGLYTSGSAGQTWSLNTNYCSPPLDGRDVFHRTSTDGSIATDHGVYKTSVSASNKWEIQPSSAGYNLRGIAFSPNNNNYGLTVGTGGVVLRTSNNGGPTAACVHFSSSNGCCINTSLSFTNLSPTTYTFTWKNNGTVFSTNYHASYNFTALGTYTISLIGTNGTTTDSAVQVISVVNPPDLTKVFSASDTLLCKSGSSDITVHNSETGVKYILYTFPALLPVDSVGGNGSNVLLSTGIITDSTWYRVKAVSNFANCGGFLSDTLLIGVEKTKASFHCHLVNAELGENVIFYNHSRQAAFFNWTFSGGSPGASSLAAPPLITYNTVGQKQTTLIATSIHACKDTATGNQPNVFDNSVTSLNASCWALDIDGQNGLFINESEKVYDIRSDKQGNLYLGGYETNAIFPSRAGVTFGRISGYGGYLSAYNSNGVLKWLSYFKDSIPAIINPSAPFATVRHIQLDNDKNIYFSGVTGYGGYLHTNSGDSLHIPTCMYVIKYDSVGKLIWYTTLGSGMWNTVGSTGSMIDYGFAIDKDGNSYIGATGYPGAVYNSLSGNQPVSYNNEKKAYLAKLDTLGKLVWITHMAAGQILYPTGYILNDIATDYSGNIYVAGNIVDLPYRFTLYSTPPFIADSAQLTSGSFYLAKYNSNGKLIWADPMPLNNGYNSSCYLDCDSAGTCYLTGIMGQNGMFASVNIPGSTPNLGKYYVASYNTAGDLNWVQGTNYTSFSNTGLDVHLGKTGTLYTSNTNWTGQPNSVVDYTSSNGLWAPMSLNDYNGSFYFSSLQTNGTLNFVNSETGTTKTNQFISSFVYGLADDLSGAIYLAGEVEGSAIQIFNSILSAAGQDGFFAKAGNSCIVPNSFVSVKNIVAGKVMTVCQPNPSTGRFTITYLGEATPYIILITNLFNDPILEAEAYSKIETIDLTDQPAGVYFISCYSSSGQLLNVNKVVIEH